MNTLIRIGQLQSNALILVVDMTSLNIFLQTLRLSFFLNENNDAIDTNINVLTEKRDKLFNIAELYNIVGTLLPRLWDS